jgi:hypothetical protein
MIRFLHEEILLTMMNSRSSNKTVLFHNKIIFSGESRRVFRRRFFLISFSFECEESGEHID